jgi:ubiquinone/menaquinone biosynthesis C-methylase UbiE
MRVNTPYTREVTGIRALLHKERKMNYFDSKFAAERYVKGRGNIHTEVIKKVKSYLKIEKKVANVLDLGCGTGLSTAPLLEIAGNVMGMDISAEMIRFAPPHERITYIAASAENIPLADQSMDLITTATAAHWFNIGKFFKEIKRVLKDMGYLVVYGEIFVQEMSGNDKFHPWYSETYLKKYPFPVKFDIDSSEEYINKQGFALQELDNYRNLVKMDKNRLFDYMISQSNIISAVKDRQQNIETINAWLSDQLDQFFAGENHMDSTPERGLVFHNYIFYMHKLL